MLNKRECRVAVELQGGKKVGAVLEERILEELLEWFVLVSLILEYF